MHLIDEVKLSPAKITSTIKESSSKTPAKKESKAQALKRKITGAMPARRYTVDNASNPASAHSRVMRSVSSKSKPSAAVAKKYHY